MKTFKYFAHRFVVQNKTVWIVFCSLFLSTQMFAAPGRLDFNFPQVLASGADVAALETQTDGKVLVAGKFTTRGAVLRRDVVRLNADGTLDTTFDFGSGTDDTGFISFIKLQADGKILIAGSFNRINGEYRRAIARLNSNGSIDATFNLMGIDVTFVRDLDVQTDGKILISASNLIGSSFVTRLNADGTNEPGHGVPLFSGNGGGSNYKVTFAPTQNKILIGGSFTYTVNQTQYENLARLNLDGTIDPTFNVNITNVNPFELLIKPKLLDSGKILVYGKFDTVNAATRRNLAVLNANGSLDTSFNPATSGTETLLSVAVQTDGKIIIGGNNFALNTLLRGNVARLNADGTIDPIFNQGRGANGAVKTLRIRNNKLLIGGAFYRYQIFPRSGISQLSLL